METTISDEYECISVMDGYRIYVFNYLEAPDGYGLIYKATSPSGKVYIGQTVRSIKERIKRHFYSAYRKTCGNYNSKFYKAIRKYNQMMVWEIIKVVKTQEINKNEIEEIYKHDSMISGYNSTIGGEGTRGLKHSDESKNKISLSNKGKKMSDGFIKKNSERMRGENNPMHGTKMHDGHKEMLLSINIGRLVPEEERLKISLAGKGVKNTETQNNNIKMALREKYRLTGREFSVFKKETGDFIGSWKCISECAEDLNVSAGNIGSCLNGSRKTCKGYVFKYKDCGYYENSKNKRSIIVFDLNKKLVGEWQTQKQCSVDLNLRQSSISRCLNGKSKTHRQYTFKYKDEV